MPAGPLAGQTFAPGACLLTSGRSADGLTLIVWDHAQVGLPWLSGELTDEAPAYVESAQGSEGEAGSGVHGGGCTRGVAASRAIHDAAGLVMDFPPPKARAPGWLLQQAHLARTTPAFCPRAPA